MQTMQSESVSPGSRWWFALVREFWVPGTVLLGIVAYLGLDWAGQRTPAVAIAVAVTLLGSWGLVTETVTLLLKRQYALDYIAILAIAVGIIAGEYVVSAIIALMVSSGRTLEEYGVSRAKRSLTALISRLPADVLLWDGPSPEQGEPGASVPIAEVQVGRLIYLRKGEVIPLDGVLESASGLTDESSLTGEPYEIEKVDGDPVRSGTVNIGDPIVVRVTRPAGDSIYARIVEMVQAAQDEKAPMVRLADRYSGAFTVVSLLIAAFAYVFAEQVRGVDGVHAMLSVLVVATPCPLILATPIALLGGVNAAARRKIIVKNLSALETLSRIDAIIFDKTGTITLGRPQVSEVVNLSDQPMPRLLGIVEAIERSSLHPLAKALVQYARDHDATPVHAAEVREVIGQGIGGVVDGRRYTISRVVDRGGMAVELTSDGERLAAFAFEDQLKGDSGVTIARLRQLGMQLHIFTGDRREAAMKVAGQLGSDVVVKAECSPADKQAGIEALRRQGKVTAMVGDGINDAPALALADVGLVFSNEEQTAASEAADIVFLGGDFGLVGEAVAVSKRTVHIAVQSILWGIGLSIVGMGFAAFGFVPPIFGAALQEAIDVGVIVNALRASQE
ncbi:MAG: cadmium-translocating P-type ATPase [Chloroflexi bacterium]|nr:cadmium-translocating P-type ATPase [Chloroflexota bacterium]